MARRQPRPQLPCVGCGAVITGYRRDYCTLQCGERHRSKKKAARELERRKARRSTPRPCANPPCGNTITGNLRKLYCCSKCKQDVLHKRPTIEYERALRARRTAKNVEIAPLCSICKKTTARGSYYESNSPALPMIPDGIILCKSHLRGYSFFINRGELHIHDREEVFAAYLVRLTFPTTTRQSWVVMMRDAFKTNTVDTGALA